MKRIISITLVGVVVALGFFCWRQNRRALEQQAEAVVAKQQLAQVEAEAQEQERRNQSEQSRLSAANAQLAEKAAKATRVEQPLATNPSPPAAAAEPAKPKHPMAEMLHDPDMKDVFRKQAKEAVARSVKELASTNLIERLGLDMEQTAMLKKLLTQRGALGFDFLMPVMTGELDEAGLAELGRKTKADMAAITDELRSFLGEDGYKAFEAHEKSQPDRDRLEKFGVRLKEGGNALALEQREQLLAAMSEERNNFKFAIDYSDTAQIDYEHFHDFYSEDRMNNYFKEMEQLNDRILRRAQSILPVEQAAEFQEMLKLHLQKSKYVVKTTNAMLGKRAAR